MKKKFKIKENNKEVRKMKMMIMQRKLCKENNF
jgi:hypothetical protein